VNASLTTAAASQDLSDPPGTVPFVSGLPDLRDFVRDEPASRNATVIVRGGSDTAEKLVAHAERVRRAFVLDGEPVLGISVFAALDDIGPASVDGILSGKLATYRVIHLASLRDLAEAGLPRAADVRSASYDGRAERAAPGRGAVGGAWASARQPALW
jgi:hypothetical protein